MVYIQLIIPLVQLMGRAQKDLRKVPQHICDKLEAWIQAIKYEGLDAVRKIPGFHGEPLKGRRSGQRSIRLSRHYRANYTVGKKGSIELIQIEEVTKHEY